jgi:hypothetical protein
MDLPLIKFVHEKFLKIRYVTNQKIQVLVRWKDVDEYFDTWEPAETLRDFLEVSKNNHTLKTLPVVDYSSVNFSNEMSGVYVIEVCSMFKIYCHVVNFKILVILIIKQEDILNCFFCSENNKFFLHFRKYFSPSRMRQEKFMFISNGKIIVLSIQHGSLLITLITSPLFYQT